MRFFVRWFTYGSGISILQCCRRIVSFQVGKGPVRQELGKLAALHMYAHKKNEYAVC